MKLICVDCIVDHSGHSFVRKEESGKLKFQFISISFWLELYNLNSLIFAFLELLDADEKVFSNMIYI